MKRILNYIFILMAAMLAGCSDHYFDESEKLEDGYTYVTFQINDPVEIETRSTATDNERKMNDLYLLSFNSDGTLKDGSKIDLSTAIVKGTNGANSVTIKSMLRIANGDKLVALVNTGVATLPTGITSDNINEKFGNRNWAINQSDNFPMSGETVWSGSNINTIILRRSLAKIQLIMDRYSNATWRMINTPTTTSIFQPNDTTIASANLIFNTPSEKDFTSNMKYIPVFPSSTRAKNTTGISNTSFHPDRVCMLIKVTGGYYRIDFTEKNKDGKTVKWLDILRNRHYTVKVNEAIAAPYPTIEEALNSPANNLNYDIEVKGDNDNIVISTGQYALELEYDNLIAYASSKSELTIKAKAIIPVGSSMPSVNKITSEKFNINYNMNALKTEEQEISFNLKIDTHNSRHTGTIIFQLGTIKKEVTITIRNKFLDVYLGNKTITINEYDVQWTHCDEGLEYKISGTNIELKATKENIIPIKWYNYEKQAWSDKADNVAEPIFKTKGLSGYITTSITDSKRTKVMVTQAAPNYAGWAGGVVEFGGDKAFSKRLIVEAEDEPSTASNQDYKTYFWACDDYWANQQIGTANNHLALGLENTIFLTQDGDTALPPEYNKYPAAQSCWNKNFINGVKQPGNPWYLPSHYQMMQMYISYPNFTSSFLPTRYYMSSTEVVDSSTNNKLRTYHSSRFSEGMMHYNNKYGYDNTGTFKYNVRCVKDLD